MKMDEKPLEILKLGATAWNKWRAENPSIIDLTRTDLTRTDLTWANLTSVNLTSVNLTWANLTSANLTDATLTRATLAGANLTSANLTRATLAGANLTSANLTGANLYGCVNFPEWRQCPEFGSFFGWKKLSNGTISQLLIPDGTPRINGIGSRKCRAREVRVIDGDGYDSYTRKVHYQSGELIRCDKWNPDPRLVCAGGIHFYVTRRESEEH